MSHRWTAGSSNTSPVAAGDRTCAASRGSQRLRRLIGPVRNLWRAWLHRREVRYLAEFDDRALKDIGLLRADVEGALSEPLFRDPSVGLALRAHDRQAAVRLRSAEDGRLLARSGVSQVGPAIRRAAPACCG